MAVYFRGPSIPVLWKQRPSKNYCKDRKPWGRESKVLYFLKWLLLNCYGYEAGVPSGTKPEPVAAAMSQDSTWGKAVARSCTFVQNQSLLSCFACLRAREPPQGLTRGHCLPAQCAVPVRQRCLMYINAITSGSSAANAPNTLKSPWYSLNEPLVPQTLLERLGKGLHILRNTEL